MSSFITNVTLATCEMMADALLDTWVIWILIRWGLTWKAACCCDTQLSNFHHILSGKYLQPSHLTAVTFLS